jgi:hypothetical protein
VTEAAYLIGSTSDAWISKTIMRATSSPFSHCTILFHDADLGWTLLDAGWTGLHKVPLKKWLERGGRVVEMYEFPGYDLRGAMFSPGIQNLITEGYDWLGLLGGIGVLVRRALWGKPGINVMQDPKKAYCSEVSAIACLEAKIPLRLDCDPAACDPLHLMAAARDVPGRIRRGLSDVVRT